MPTLHDSPEGQTHSYGDGCGDPAHNPWWMEYVDRSCEAPNCVDAGDVPEIILEAERRALARPMGVSEWEATGRKFGYWDYFERRIRESERDGGGGMCGGIVSQSTFDSDPMAYMMAYVMPDDMFESYKKEMDEEKRKEMFEKYAKSMI